MLCATAQEKRRIRYRGVVLKGPLPSLSVLEEEKLERAKGFEPSTPTLARSCSTPELLPHPLEIVAWLSPATADLCQMRTANATASNGRSKLALRSRYSDQFGEIGSK